MILVGTQSKINFLKDVLGDILKWEYCEAGWMAAIEFKDADSKKVMKTIYDWLQTRKDMGLF